MTESLEEKFRGMTLTLEEAGVRCAHGTFAKLAEAVDELGPDECQVLHVADHAAARTLAQSVRVSLKRYAKMGKHLSLAPGDRLVVKTVRLRDDEGRTIASRVVIYVAQFEDGSMPIEQAEAGK